LNCTWLIHDKHGKPRRKALGEDNHFHAREHRGQGHRPTVRIDLAKHLFGAGAGHRRSAKPGRAPWAWNQECRGTIPTGHWRNSVWNFGASQECGDIGLPGLQRAKIAFEHVQRHRQLLIPGGSVFGELNLRNVRFARQGRPLQSGTRSMQPRQVSQSKPASWITAANSRRELWGRTSLVPRLAGESLSSFCLHRHWKRQGQGTSIRTGTSIFSAPATFVVIRMTD
jgi:hypothetical protein